MITTAVVYYVLDVVVTKLLVSQRACEKTDSLLPAGHFLRCCLGLFELHWRGECQKQSQSPYKTKTILFIGAHMHATLGNVQFMYTECPDAFWYVFSIQKLAHISREVQHLHITNSVIISSIKHFLSLHSTAQSYFFLTLYLLSPRSTFPHSLWVCLWWYTLAAAVFIKHIKTQCLWLYSSASMGNTGQTQ